MNRWKAILFDFDYTLGDSTEGVALSVNYALERLGFGPKGREEIRKTIGMSMKDTLFALTGRDSQEEAARFAGYFKEKADEAMVEHTALYEGAAEALARLKRAGFQIGIVTTKYHYRIEQILSRFQGLELVDLIIGAEDVKIEKPDPEGLLKAIGDLRLEKDQVLYVGDSLVDAKTAENGRVSFAGVLTGTTAREEFQAYRCVRIEERVQDLCDWILRA